MKTRTLTPTTVCKNYLDELESKALQISYYNDKIFGPASQIAEICDEINCLDFKIKDKNLRRKREMALIEKRQALLEKLEDMEKEEPEVNMPSLNALKALAEGKSLDNDGLCAILSKATNTPWHWTSAFDTRTPGSKTLIYGLKFICPKGEIHCFIGSTNDGFKAKTANTALKSMNWFEAITDTQYRDEFRSQPTCLRISPFLRKTILDNLAMQCTKKKDFDDAQRETSDLPHDNKEKYTKNNIEKELVD